MAEVMLTTTQLVEQVVYNRLRTALPVILPGGWTYHQHLQEYWIEGPDGVTRLDSESVQQAEREGRMFYANIIQRILPEINACAREMM